MTHRETKLYFGRDSDAKPSIGISILQLASTLILERKQHKGIETISIRPLPILHSYREHTETDSNVSKHSTYVYSLVSNS